jgi:hypothetical protein
MRQAAYSHYLATGQAEDSSDSNDGMHSFSNDVLVHAKNVQVSAHLRNLYAHLLENHYIDSISGFDPSILHIFSREVLRRIGEHDASWEVMVPTAVATAIKKRQLFGYIATGK